MNININTEKNKPPSNTSLKNICDSNNKIIHKSKHLETNKKDITITNSIKTNYLSWIILFICIFIVSFPYFGIGIFTFFVMILCFYFGHLLTHQTNNIFTIIHQYHHLHNNFFSHFSQIILELSIPVVLVPFYYLYGNVFFDVWTVALFIFYYSTIHNYNYGYKKVNDVHYKHHLNVYTNIGPDICDTIFGTKNDTDDNVENTNHYIPNIIIGTIIISFIKYFCNINSWFKSICIYGTIISLLLFFVFLIISSIILYFFQY